MKSKFLTYALLFALLLILFQYVNSKQIIDKYEVDIKTYKAKIETLQLESEALKAELQSLKSN
jgi:cell division protein FtsB